MPATKRLGEFLRTKLAPLPGSTLEFLDRKDAVGNEVSPKDTARKLVMPISFGEIYNTMKDQGVAKGTAISLLAVFGMGTQTYKKKYR